MLTLQAFAAGKGEYDPTQLDRWDKETVPASVDPKVAEKVKLFNALEAWDHW